jgi:hypothetical protein
MDNKQLAQGIASLGRGGDTTLMHMRPEEVQQLQAISRAGGGEITINPDTGMPEAFLGDFFGALLPTAAGLAAGAIFPGAPFLAPALAGGTTAFLQGKRDPLSIGMGALSGYGGGQLGSSLSGFGATQGATAGSAEIAGGASGTPVTDAALTGQTIGGTGGTTAGANAFGQEQFISPFNTAGQQTLGGFGTQSVTGALNPTLPATTGVTYAGPTGMAQTLPPPPTLAYRGPVSSAPRPNFGAAPSSPKDQLSAMADYTGDTSMMQSKRLGSFEKGIDLGRGLAETGKGFQAAMNDPMGYLKYAGNGSALIGGVKTALPFAGAGLEAYQKGIYEDMPMAGDYDIYDPYSRLDLSGDTGLRLLASGGQIKRYANGGETSKDYGVNPQYKLNFGSSSMPALGLNNNDGRMRVPVKGFIDVSGHFKASPDGDITDVEYEKEYSAMWNPKDKYGSSDISSFAANQMGQIPAGVGALLGNVVSNIGEARDSAPSESQTLKTEPLAKGGKVKGYMGGGVAGAAPGGLGNDTRQGGGGGVPGAAPGGLGNDTRAMGMPTGLGNSLNTINAGGPKAVETALNLITGNQEPVYAPLGLSQLAKGGKVKYQMGGVTESLDPHRQEVGYGLSRLDALAKRQAMEYAEGGISELTPDAGKYLNGNGDGVSDDIPATIEGEQEAALSDGEFIVPARIVSELGNGSSDAGAKKLYEMIDRIQAARQQTIGDNKEYAKDTNAERYLPV